MSTRTIRILVIAVGGLLLAPTAALGRPAAKAPPPAKAQPPPQMPKPEAKKPKPVRASGTEEVAPSGRKQYMTFDDDDVVASRDGGMDGYVRGERRAKHSSLIHVRQDFIDELARSAEDI